MTAIASTPRVSASVPPPVAAAKPKAATNADIAAPALYSTLASTSKPNIRGGYVDMVV